MNRLCCSSLENIAKKTEVGVSDLYTSAVRVLHSVLCSKHCW